ncbi:MAG TPA: hypothetical protein VMT16_11635 [Thermoanaerobaculia bacterium]|nr:hypothetical protein [Thermoanaerobaculia bacterium]
MRATLLLTLCLLAALPSAAAIRRDPNGVNVNAQGATTVFITFGGLAGQVPVEATWCGELIPAAPDIGFKCDPATVFGRLPLRFDQSRLTAGGTVFTDIMSIPASVARRAYQAAARGENSAFFYVRRFVSTAGGPDEYVFVTCRMAGGGARVPLALLDVQLRFVGDDPVFAVPTGGTPPPLQAEIHYNGTGRLQGRWEVVLPGDEPPTSRDLLTEATLPPEERPLQRRYTLVERFNVFLPPTGQAVLPGPDPARLPTGLDGLHQVLLRVEATADKEGDSNLALAGAGQGIVHSGAVAGFPLPTLRYFVGSAADAVPAATAGLVLLLPAEGALRAAGEPVDFSWSLAADAALYRVEITGSEGGEPDFAAVLQQGIGTYRAPVFLPERLGAGAWWWRVVALGPGGDELTATPWRPLEAADE